MYTKRVRGKEYDNMYIDSNTIITTGSIITAVIIIFSCIFTIYRWYLRQNKKIEEINRLKEEQCLICYGLLSCLDGLKQLGANGNVSEAYEKLEKHINQSAHK